MSSTCASRTILGRMRWTRMPLLNWERRLPIFMAILTSLVRKKRSVASVAVAHEAPTGLRAQERSDQPCQRARSEEREAESIIKDVMVLASRRSSESCSVGPQERHMSQTGL